MEFISIKATQGPNIWSITHKKLIVATFDTGTETATIEKAQVDWDEKLLHLFPSLCCISHKGVRKEHIPAFGEKGVPYAILYTAIQLQNMAGMHTEFGLVKPIKGTTKSYIVFEYDTEGAGRQACHSALKIVKAMLSDEEINLQAEVEEIEEIHISERFGPSTASIVNEAHSRGIPAFTLPGGYVQLGYGANQKRISATITSDTQNISVEIAGDKEETKKMLDYFRIPVPKGTIVYDRHELQDAINEIGYPIVTKPLNGNQGKGATINIRNYHCALGGLLAARKYSRAVIVEKYITGLDYRLLVVGGKFVAASLRTPAMVTGDGKSTLKQLIEDVNKDPRRGHGHEKTLTKIRIDDMSKRILKDKGLKLTSILGDGEELYLKDTANLSTGGTATDVTEEVHPDNIFMAEMIADIVGLDICGIDIMTPDISLPVKESGGAVLEVNAAPGFRMHTHPTAGTPRNVAKPVIDMLFPKGATHAIPIVAITGTNGKTTTTRLIAHIAAEAGKNVGFTNTDGIYLKNKLVERGDSSGPGSAELILKCPSVDFAVLECARGGILRSGLSFNECDVAVVTNVAADHIGIGGIDTVEALASVKSVVAESVKPKGYAVLNADNDYSYNMRENTPGNIALFSLDPENNRIQYHCKKGGLAAVLKDGRIKILEGMYETDVQSVDKIPITFDGKASFMVENVLAGVLAAYKSGFSIDVIRKALVSFNPGAGQTPGRMNLFKVNGFDVMVDFAHNAHGMKAIGSFIEKFNAPVKIGVIGAVGDRRDEDIRELGRNAATVFDEIIIRQDKDLRGRTEEEMVKLVRDGINEVAPSKPVVDVANEIDALHFALDHAPDGAFITMLSDKVQVVIEEIEKLAKSN